MPTTAELLDEGRHHEIWEKYCGFLDLDIEQFMNIQRRLLLEQIRLLSRCEMGRHFLSDDIPESVEEFRDLVPLTTYKDYLDYLPTKQEDKLPSKPHVWMRTSGRTGEYGGKWVPVSPQFYASISGMALSSSILASARFKGDIRLRKGDVFLYTLAPPPYITGTTVRAIDDVEFPFTYVPSIAEAEQMDFQERIEQGFLLSMETGIDYFMGIASVLMRIGEAFSEGSGRPTANLTALLKPRTITRLSRALVRARLKNRALMPKDIWTPKGIMASGMDVQIFKSRIEEMWGITPFEAYACTEFGGIAMQSWGARSAGLTMVPDSAFWEFIPEEEYKIWRDDRTYKPVTLLYDQVSTGRYVLVGTSFLGGAFVRYVIGDLVSVIGLEDATVDVALPQIVMEARADEVIDIGSLVLLTERSMWKAMGVIDSAPADWVVRKEYNSTGKPILNMYAEGVELDSEKFKIELHEALIKSVKDYSTFYDMMDVNPVKVTKLSTGTFQNYLVMKQEEGADLGQLKPQRMQPSQQVMDLLLGISANLAG